MQEKIGDEYAQGTGKQCQDRKDKALTVGVAFGSGQGSMYLIYALLFWYGSTLINSGEITFEQLMIAIFSLMLGALGLGQALAGLNKQVNGVEAAGRIFKAIDESSASVIDGLSTAGLKPATRPKGLIELKNVTFRYPSRPDIEVCKGYNLTIEPGQVVALVGPSGSGKSTIISLLLRFYDPLQGSVCLDGIDIKDLNVRWLRSQIGYVGQEPILFVGSVASNIAKGRSNADDAALVTLQEVLRSHGGYALCPGVKLPYAPVANTDVEAPGQAVDEDIIQAARASNAHDFISDFQHGYNTDVGENSAMVSGGQKQRIAIARALVKRPAVLLLDEATSALDATSEKLVQESIDQLQESKMQTTIVIAHRLSTIRNADKIVVIDKGEIVETGTHDELLALGGLYLQLWSKQVGTASTEGQTESTKMIEILNSSTKA